LTLRGTPTLYYGDEIGMPQVAIAPDQVRDPFEKNVPGIGVGRDGCRTPMQWDATLYAGFSTSTPWLPLSDDFPQENVVNLDANGQSILSLYKALIRLRKKLPQLTSGNYVPIGADGDLLLYRRQNEAKAVVIAAPHSTNWDVIWGLLVKVGLRLDVHFIGKREAFFWPLGSLLRSFGGLPIDRKAAHGVVGEMARQFAGHERFWLAIAPEGTRKKVQKWKSGFWHIARAAHVPIIPIYFHYPWSEEDKVTIALPKGYALDSADSPAPLTAGAVCHYAVRMGATKDERTLVYFRSFFFGGNGTILFPAERYVAVKQLFDQINKADNHTITLKQNSPAN